MSDGTLTKKQATGMSLGEEMDLYQTYLQGDIAYEEFLRLQCGGLASPSSRVRED